MVRICHQFGCTEEHGPSHEYMRLDVVFEGAVDQDENFTEEAVWSEWNLQLENLESDYPDREWVISVYDERTYPPTLVKEHVNEPLDT